jgi:hypothetical protein
MRDYRGRLHYWRRHRATLHVEFQVAAFHLELGNILLHQKLDELSQFFLIHRIPSLKGHGSSHVVGPLNHAAFRP